MSLVKLFRKIGRSSDRATTDQVDRLVTLPQLLAARSVSTPNLQPLCLADDRVLSYLDWHQKSESIALGLVAEGVTPGTVVALLFDGQDWLHYAIAYIAVLRVGATAMHLNAHMPESEIIRRLTDCQCKRIIKSHFIKRPMLFAGDVSNLEQFYGHTGSLPDIHFSELDVAEIRYTSGTTGLAKGYLVTNGNLLFGRTLDGMSSLSSSSNMLVPMTLGTSTSATILTIAVTSPVKLVLCSPLDVEAMGRLIEGKKIGSVMVTPHVGSQMVEAKLDERYDLSCVKLVASASSPLMPSVANRLLEIMPNAKLQIACAQSEASPALITQNYDPGNPFCVGSPVSGTELRICDADGNNLGANQIGEIWLRTAAPKRLFLKDTVTNEALLRDGWYHTGDLGRLDDGGRLEYFDRKVDALIRDGELVSSIAIEADILACAAVREVAVVDVENHRGETNVVAFVVLKDASALNDVKRSINEVLTPSHCPDIVISIANLPRTHNGKVLKRSLRYNVGIF